MEINVAQNDTVPPLQWNLMHTNYVHFFSNFSTFFEQKYALSPFCWIILNSLSKIAFLDITNIGLDTLFAFLA